jgi:hypothetical protein
MELEKLLVTLREHGVCRWKGPVKLGGSAAWQEVELELFQHAPRPAAEAPRSDERIQPTRLNEVPEALRKTLTPEQYERVQATAARLYPVAE